MVLSENPFGLNQTTLKEDMSEILKQPAETHQSQPSAIPCALEASVQSKEQVLDNPQIGSEVTSHSDSKFGSAHSSSSPPYKEDSQQMSSLHISASDQQATSDHSKDFNAKTMGHQGSTSPGPVDMAQSSHPMLAANEEPNQSNPHLTSQMRPDTLMHEPPAHAMSLPTNAPQTLSQTPPPQPPHGSQVPLDEAPSLIHQYPMMWQGLLALKNGRAAVQMHYLSGNKNMALFPPAVNGERYLLRIGQRLRLGSLQLEDIAKKIQLSDEHCLLLAVPCGKDHMDVIQHSRNLATHFIRYLQEKQAAGIVHIALPGCQQPAPVIHLFPPSYMNHHVAACAPELFRILCHYPHLAIVIAAVTDTSIAKN